MTYAFEFYFATKNLSEIEISRRVISAILSSGIDISLSGEQSGHGWWSSYLGSSDIAAEAEELLLEVNVDRDLIGELVTAATAEGAPREITESDAFAKVTLIGDGADWKLVRSIWESLQSMWLVIAADDGSGFDVKMSSLPS
jgi:hypothetical protein